MIMAECIPGYYEYSINLRAGEKFVGYAPRLRIELHSHKIDSCYLSY